MGQIAIIDYGLGNVHSVQKALASVADDQDIILTSYADQILAADRVILPGVGAIRDCMQALNKLGLVDCIQKVITKGTPFLGICVGYQALLERSEENEGTACLAHFSGQVRHFSSHISSDSELKIPHMGWNQVAQQPHPLWQGIADNSRFYFVHSYYVQLAQPELAAASSYYGLDFDAALADKNVFAVQFHPEKSGKVGLQLLRNFVVWQPEV